MRTITAGWDAFRAHAITPSTDPALRRAVQAAFYAGASYVVDELVDLQLAQPLPDAYVHHLAQWSGQINRDESRAAREGEI